MTESETLGRALLNEINRVKNVIPIYDCTPGGQIAATMMRHDVQQAEDALVNGDLVQMIALYSELEEWKL